MAERRGLMERLDGLAGALDGVRPVAAATVREAIEEITGLRIALDEARHPGPGQPASRLVFMQDATPEVYVYRLTWWVERADGIYLPDSSRLERSTPILTCEDVRVIEREISRNLRARVKGLHHTLMKD